jgi:hypothetical protein
MTHEEREHYAEELLLRACRIKRSRLLSRCEAAERLAREGEEVAGPGRWHQAGLEARKAWETRALAEQAEIEEELSDTWAFWQAVLEDVPPELGLPRTVTPVFAELGDLVSPRLVSVSERLEMLLEAADAGASFSDSTGQDVNRWLRELGVRRPLEQHQEALWSTLNAILKRGVHPAWKDSDQDAPAPFWRRLRFELRVEAKRLQVLYGDGTELGTKDQTELDLDHRDAQRLARGRSWRRMQRCLGQEGEDFPEDLRSVNASPVEAGALEMVSLERVARDERELLMCRLIAHGAKATDAAVIAGLSRSAFRAFQARAKRRSQ